MAPIMGKQTLHQDERNELAMAQVEAPKRAIGYRAQDLPACRSWASSWHKRFVQHASFTGLGDDALVGL